MARQPVKATPARPSTEPIEARVTPPRTSIAVPRLQRRPGFSPRSLTVRLTPEEARVLHALRESLKETKTKVRGDRPVATSEDAVVWLVEEMGRAHG